MPLRAHVHCGNVARSIRLTRLLPFTPPPYTPALNGADDGLTRKGRTRKFTGRQAVLPKTELLYRLSFPSAKAKRPIPADLFNRQYWVTSVPLGTSPLSVRRSHLSLPYGRRDATFTQLLSFSCHAHTTRSCLDHDKPFVEGGSHAYESL